MSVSYRTADQRLIKREFRDFIRRSKKNINATESLLRKYSNDNYIAKVGLDSETVRIFTEDLEERVTTLKVNHEEHAKAEEISRKLEICMDNLEETLEDILTVGSDYLSPDSIDEYVSLKEHLEDLQRISPKEPKE